ncbi:MAG: PLP-dependent transferase, partial [Pirellulaceae bacterium]
MNPTQDVMEKRMAAMEGGGAALALASGTSAIFYSIINICSAGQEIVSAPGRVVAPVNGYPSQSPQIHTENQSD